MLIGTLRPIDFCSFTPLLFHERILLATIEGTGKITFAPYPRPANSGVRVLLSGKPEANLLVQNAHRSIVCLSEILVGLPGA